ncbi:hypothetical protein B0H19DRAFT_1069932 [Mycena capillaripes]|nr:hypothetical protein B0H19DRAFT_1069932 [Mycena capillaripes]
MDLHGPFEQRCKTKEQVLTGIKDALSSPDLDENPDNPADTETSLTITFGDDGDSGMLRGEGSQRGRTSEDVLMSAFYRDSSISYKLKAPRHHWSLVNGIASATQDVYLDLKELFSRLGDAACFRGPRIALDELYKAYAHLLETGLTTSRALPQVLDLP